MEKVPLPSSFLTLPFQKNAYRVLGGWFYEQVDFIAKLTGSANHYAVDYILPRKTPVLASAEGWALSSYHHFLLRNKKDRRRFIRYRGKLIGSGQGNFIVILHPKEKVFTQYSHLDSISPFIPFHPPVKKRGSVLPLVKKFQPSFFKEPNAKWVKRGEVIGWVGDSGIIGDWDPPQLHFEVYRYRDKDGGKPKDSYLDPYDIYKTAKFYPWPGHKREVGVNQLWVLAANGLPKSSY